MSVIKTAKRVIEIELNAINQLTNRVDDNFSKICQCVFDCQGKVVLMGVGKSGHIAGKIAATLASTGTPSFFIHPAEAGHGDLGMVDDKDIIIAISYSGENEELRTLLPIIARLNVTLIAMVGKPHSTLAKHADFCLDISVNTEACPHNLAPTSSTTATLVLGDALAIALLEKRGFSVSDFARSHPAGALGRKLLTQINDIMHQGSKLPLVKRSTTLKNSIIEMSSKQLGTVIIVDDNHQLLGLFTDGDLRRVLEKNDSINHLTIADVMTTTCQSITVDTLASSAMAMMEKYRINSLPVVDKQHHVVGVLNMHTLLNAKII